MSNNLFLNDLCELKNRRIILASQSPRRDEMLRNLGLRFEIVPADVDENPESFRDAADFAMQNAREKAVWVAEREPADLVIAADTIVVQNGEILGKPVNAADAEMMLRKLSGKTHQVISAICLKTPDREITDSESTDVTFISLSDQEIGAYLATGESMDKAGGYGIQGFAAPFISGINGCYPNVVGFPIALFYKHLRTLKFK
ncbi:MAG: Maf family protein [Calditrichia bacterium]